MLGIGDSDGRQRHGPLQRLAGPRLGRAEGSLALRPAPLDGRQVRRLWGQGQPPGAGLFHGRATPRHRMRPQVVHDHEVPRAPRRAEDLCPRDLKHLGIGGAVDRQHRLTAAAPEGRQHRDMRPIVLRGATNAPLPLRSTTIPARHGEVDARFITALEALGGERGDGLLRGRSRLLDAFGVARAGVERLLLRGTPSAMTRRPMVGTLRRSPR
jgi:hypothetical protein